MKSTPPPPLEDLRRRLANQGFIEQDCMPDGGFMGSEKLLIHRDSLVFEIGADRSFWFVAAGPYLSDEPLEKVATFKASVWEALLHRKDPRNDYQEGFAKTDEEELQQLTRRTELFLQMLPEMLQACRPERIQETSRWLREEAGLAAKAVWDVSDN